MSENWKEEYNNYLLEGRLDYAKEIKNKNIDRKLYKYRCFDKNNHWEDWIKDEIFTSFPSKFNDPFDCLITLDDETLKNQIREACLTYLKDNVKLKKIDIDRMEVTDDPVKAVCIILEQHGKRINRERIDKSIFNRERYSSSFREIFKISCFSERNDSILMWSHYTNNHQGFCIEYDFSQEDSIKKLLYPVAYSLRRFKIIPQYKDENKWVIPTVLYKSPEWAYECEWRYVNAIIPKNPEDSLIRDFTLYAPKAIKAIYLGVEAVKYNGNCIDKMKHIVKEQEIELYEMRMDDNEYKILPQRLQI